MTQGDEFQDALSGSFWEIATVEDYDGEETETFIGNTTAGISTSHDREEFDVNPSTGDVTFTQTTHRQITLEFEAVVDDADTALSDADLINDDNELVAAAVHSAVRLYIYDKDPSDLDDAAEDASRVIAYPDAEVAIDGEDMGDADAGTLDFNVNVRGRPVFEHLAE